MFLKKQTFEQDARKYWERHLCGILVPGERGCSPSEGEVLCMYNDMKTRRPNCVCNILRLGKGQGDIFQPGDKISGIFQHILRRLKRRKLNLKRKPSLRKWRS